VRAASLAFIAAVMSETMRSLKLMANSTQLSTDSETRIR
jgi:hypothetical protein